MEHNYTCYTLTIMNIRHIKNVSLRFFADEEVDTKICTLLYCLKE